jgi:hypothetical protein
MNEEQKIETPVKAKTKRTVKKDCEECEPSKPGKWKNLLGVILILAMGAGAVWAWQHYGLKAKANGTDEKVVTEQSTDELNTEQLLAKVSRLIVLPAGETPTIASVVDADKLKSEQAFYRDVQNNDFVLIYPQAQKAFIYRPATDVLVNVGPVYMNDAPAANNTATEEPAVPAKPLVIEVRNGVNKAGLAGALRDELNLVENYNVTKVADAGNKNYKQYILVNLGVEDNQKALLVQLEAKFGVTAVTELPAGEAASEAQLLIIIGQ